MVQLRKVSVLAVSMAAVVSGAFSEEGREAGSIRGQEQVVNVDLIEADADFERLLGGTHYGSYPHYGGKSSKADRDVKGGKGSKGYYGDDDDDDGKGAKGGKGSKGYYGDDDDDDGKGAKGGKGSKGYYGDDDDDDGKGGKGTKQHYVEDKPDKYEKVRLILSL